MNTLCTVFCIALASAATSVSGAQASATGSPPSQRAGDQPHSISERVAAMKTSMAESQKRLRGYEWIETTVVMLKDEEKSRTQQRCYWGADGKVQKVPLAESSDDERKGGERKGGIRGRIADRKKAELTDSMKQAVELVKKYVPPQPEALEKAAAAGNVAITVLEPRKRIRLDFSDYLLTGDSLKAEMTLPDNRLAVIAISTFIESEGSDHKDPVALAVRMGTLADGTTFTEETVLDVQEKHLKVTVTNSGYRKITK